jgi:hypothetical protein
MNKIDLIIDALEAGLKLSDGFISEWNQINKALAAAHELQALKPVAYIDHVSGKPKFINGYVVQTDYDIPLYTAPLQAEKQEPVAWEYQEYRSAFMGNLQWFDTVQFVQPPNDPELFRNIKPLFTSPPRKEWVGLTKEEIIGHTCECVDDVTFNMDCAIDFANALQETLKRYNT